MATKPLNPSDEYVETGNLKIRGRTPAMIALAEKRMEALESLFPMDHCRELVKLALVQQDAQFAAGDPVVFPELAEEDLQKAQAELQNPNMSDEEKQGIQTLLSFFGKRVSELPPLTAEEEAERLEDEVNTAAGNIVRAWLNALHFARGESGDKPVRLDSSLLPPSELTRCNGFGELDKNGYDWAEWLTNSLVLTAEQIRELMALFATRLIVVFDATLANKPNGIELTEDILVRKDKDGFYLPPEVKE